MSVYSSRLTVAGGETRTISLYHVHTKESLTVTYMKDGRYIPSAMKKINYLLRDWRRDQAIRIDPKSVDLLWELHADLGSQRPVHIVSGYRSPRTNAFLKRIGRNVAKHSQHMKGKAIDFYFPDVATQKIRNSALARGIGGVGYYRTSGGPTGFLHIDSGKVRHWGPRISSSQMAQIMREGRKTIGRRLTRTDGYAVAEAAEGNGSTKKNGILNWLAGGGKKKQTAPEPVQEPVEEDVILAAKSPVYEGDSEDMAELAADASVSPGKTKLKPADIVEDTEIETDSGELANLSASAASERPEGVAVGTPIPRPRLKPIEIMMMAAANMKIEPASAPPPDQLRSASGTGIDDAIAILEQTSLPEIEDPVLPLRSNEQISNTASKGDFGMEVPAAPEAELPRIRPFVAAAAIEEVTWWPHALSTRPAETEVLDARIESFAAKPDVEVVREGKGNLDPAALGFASVE